MNGFGAGWDVMRVKLAGDPVAHYRTFTKYLIADWGYFAVSEARNLVLGPAHDGDAIDGLINGFHATKHGQRIAGRGVK